MHVLKVILLAVAEFVLHVVEFVQESRHSSHPHHERERGPVPKDSSCYPYYTQLTDAQLVRDVDFAPPPDAG